MSNYYKINEEKVVVRRIENHIIILDVDTGEFISADDVACLIVELIMEGKSENEIIGEITKEFQCPSQETVKSDFQEFIIELQQKGILIK